MKSQRNFSLETLVIAGSFVAVWIYFGARIWAGRAEIQLSPFWQLLLLPALVLLAIVFVRRTKRVINALRGRDEQGSYPPRFPSVNGRDNH
jgi:membrane protein implicated in regulation of membrane protease activity